MLLEMFVNELSLGPAHDVQTAQERARQCVLTMLAATARGVKRRLRLPDDFQSKPLAEGYYWQNWRNDNSVELELRQYFRSLATQIPFLGDDPVNQAQWTEIDCLFRNQRSQGLKAAYVANGLALSMSSGPEWGADSIECEIQEIVNEDVASRNEFIHHASSPEHVVSQTDWIHERIQHTIESGRDLWQRVEDFFPHLLWCSEAEQQVVNLPALSLPSIVRGLIRLNAFCLDWQNGPFVTEAIGCRVSPDSQPTIQQYGPERTFQCPDGESRVFTWHAKVGQWRIYFDPAAGPGYLYIGYVGDHLRTVRHN